MFCIFYPADEHYHTAHVAGVPTYENAVQVIAAPRRLISLYAFNKHTATVYLKVQDSKNAGTDGGPIVVYPIAAGSFVSITFATGKRFENGIYLKAFGEAALTNAASGVLLYDVDFSAYL